MIFVLSGLRCMAAHTKVFPTSVITFISVPSIPSSCRVYSAVCKLMSGFVFFCTSYEVLSGVQSSIYLAVQTRSEVERAASDVPPAVVGHVE